MPPTQHFTLLIARSNLTEDGNYLRLANQLFARGCTVQLCFMDSLAMVDSEVIADGFLMQRLVDPGSNFPECGPLALRTSDVVWTLTLGMRHSFLDKIQLLRCLEQDCRLVNSLDALLHFKSKYFMARQADVFRYPKTYASTDPEALLSYIETQGGQWIAKPPAGSLGRDIYLLHKADPNTRVILESMTGPEADRYCLLQPYVKEIQQGEKRVLFAGGDIVDQYLRVARFDHRTNVTAGADVSACELEPGERHYCERIGEFLLRHGVQFAAMDLAYPFVIEFNVINPGGLTTLESVHGADRSGAVIDGMFPELSTA